MADTEIQEILSILSEAVKLLKVNDKYLIDHSVHEQDLSHRIAHYFENLLNNYDWYKKSQFNIDVEYNKNFDDSKKVYLNCHNCNKSMCYIKQEHYNIDNYQSTCKPDIILHERGSNNNILAIEIKKNQTICTEDFAKLSAFTCTESDYKYLLGVYINIASDSNILFENGYIKIGNNPKSEFITKKETVC